MKKSFIIVLLLTLLSFASKAQYEHRFSATFSAGSVSTFSTVETVDELSLFSTEYDPAAFANFETGYAITGGFHLNPGKRFTLAINVNYIGLNTWSYDYDIEESFLNNKVMYADALIAQSVGIGAAPRLYLNPRSGWRVYMQLEASINYLTLTYDDGFSGYNEILKSTYAFGIQPSFGLDVRITEHIGIFLQNGVAFNMYSKSQFPTSFFDKTSGTDRPVDLQKDNLNMLRIDLGLRFSFLKSKKI